MTFRLPVVAVFIAVVLAVGGYTYAAPIQPQASAGLKPINSLVIVRGADLVNLHPNRTTDPDSQNVMRSIYEALIYAGPDMQPAPELAERWTQVNDSTYRFFLRRGVEFHNGQPFTADDVVYTFNQVNSPPPGVPPFLVRAYSFIVEEVVKENDYQVLVKLKTPFPIALYNLSRINIVPRTVALDKLTEQPVGTGPYKYVAWVKGSQVTLVANDKHWRGRPLSRTLTWKTIPENASRVAELISGRAHIATKIPPEMGSLIDRNKDYEVRDIQDSYIIHVDINTYKPLMQNPLVRQAIYHAIDRQALLAGVAKGLGTPVNGPVIPQAFGYDTSFKDFEHNPDRAKALLREAGYPGGIDIKLAVPRGRYVKDTEVAEAVAQQLTAVGIRTQVVVREWGVHLQLNQERKTDELFFIGWSNPPFDYLQWYYHIPRTHQYSLAQSEKLEALVDEAGRTVNPRGRMEVARKLYAAWKEYVPTVALYQQKAYYGVKASVAFVPRPDEAIRPDLIGER